MTSGNRLSSIASIVAVVCAIMTFGTGYDQYNGDHVTWPVIFIHAMSALLGFIALRATIAYEMSTPWSVAVYNAALIVFLWIAYRLLNSGESMERHPELKAFGLYFFPFISVPGSMLLSHIYHADRE